MTAIPSPGHTAPIARQEQTARTIEPKLADKRDEEFDALAGNFTASVGP